MNTTTRTVKQVVCRRCGHLWWALGRGAGKKGMPRVCSKCKSYNWQTPRPTTKTTDVKQAINGRGAQPGGG